VGTRGAVPKGGEADVGNERGRRVCREEGGVAIWDDAVAP